MGFSQAVLLGELLAFSSELPGPSTLVGMWSCMVTEALHCCALAFLPLCSWPQGPRLRAGALGELCLGYLGLPGSGLLWELSWAPTGSTSLGYINVEMIYLLGWGHLLGCVDWISMGLSSGLMLRNRRGCL